MALGLALLSTAGISATYDIDTAHSDVGFSIRHLGVSKTRGQFNDVKGMIKWSGEKDLAAAHIEGHVIVKSIDTGNAKRDAHLIGADFFEANKHPHMTFTSKRFYKKRGQLYVSGDLMIHGITRRVDAPIEVLGPVNDPWGNEKLGMEVEFEINRKDYGLNWNKKLDQGGLLIGEKVEVEISVEAGARK